MISLDKLRALAGLRDHRFVPLHYESIAPADRFFAVISDPATIDRMRTLLAAAAARCQEKHDQPCGCPAQRVCHAPDRTLLVLHDVR